MSNVDLLQEHEARTAADQGWALCDVYDGLRTRRQILPLSFERPFDNAEKTLRWVIRTAQNGDKTAQRALKLLMKDKK